jgi:hypothetical protein
MNNYEESSTMKEFEENKNYKIGIIMNKIKKDNPSYEKSFEPIVHKGEYYLDKGILTTLDYFTKNPDNLPNKVFTIHKMNEETSTWEYFDEGTVERITGGLGELTPVPIQPQPKTESVPADNQKIIEELLKQKQEAENQKINAMNEAFTQRIHERDSMIQELRNQIQSLQNNSNIGNPFLEKEYIDLKAKYDMINSEYRTALSDYNALEIEKESEINDLKSEINDLKKELVHKEVEDKMFNEHQEVINAKQKEIDELAQKPKGLSGLGMGIIEKLDGQTVNTFMQEVIPSLGALIKLGVDKLTNKNQSPYPYPQQPMQEPEIYDPTYTGNAQKQEYETVDDSMGI